MNPYTEGPTDCKIAIVGEAPGAKEIALGRPFVGPAGKVLDSVLQSAGLPRPDCLITNVLPFMPKDIDDHLNLRRRTPTESDDFRRACDDLARLLASSTCRVVIALGNVALYALCRVKNIRKWRGSPIDCQLVPGKIVVPTIHPSAILRSFPERVTYTCLDKHLAVMDVKKAMAIANGHAVLPERELLIRPSYHQAISFLRECRDLPEVAVDIETRSGHVYCIAVAQSATRAMSIPFVLHGEDYFNVDQESDVWREIAALLEDPRVLKIGQNIVFDFSFLYELYGIIIRPVADTMIGHAIIAPEFPKSLEFLTSIYTYEPYYKDELKVWRRLPESDDRLFIYNCKDAAVCMEMWPKIKHDLERLGNWEAYERQVALVEPLVYMSCRGMRVCPAYLKLASENAALKERKLRDQLRELAGSDINPASPKQLAELFYVKLGYEPYVTTTPGREPRITTDDEALRRLERRGCEAAAVVRRIRAVSKMRSTYLDVQLDPQHRLRCSYNPVGTKFGRLSSSKTISGLGTNMQNLPMAMKHALIADPGRILLSFDLSQAENRVVAFVAGEEKMMRAFTEGQDVHKMTASFIYGKPPEEITPEERQGGKRANHALNYGMGYKSFALEYTIPEKEAKRIYHRYHEAYPAIRLWHERVRRQLESTRKVVNCFGRTYFFLDSFGPDLLRAALSAIPQGTVAEITNTWGLKYFWDHPEVFSDAEILNQVHDSIVLQVVETGDIPRIVRALTASLSRPLSYEGRTFSIPVDVSIGYTLGSMEPYVEV